MRTKSLSILLALLLFSSCENSFLKSVSASFAKEYCSCRFVEKLNKDYCATYAKQFIMPKFIENETTQVISAKALGIKSVVKYRSKRLGCAFVQ